MKILNYSRIKELDTYTILHEPIASIGLMERACHAFVGWMTEHFDASKKIGVVCGTGNNGGDGLGIARMLHDWNYPVKVWVVRGGVKETEDFAVNLKRLENKIPVTEISENVSVEIFQDRAILIDAIFGSGLSRPASGIYEDVIAAMNQSSAIKIAVDIPSGLMADEHSTGEIFRADYTISFQQPKLAFMMPENQVYVGDWHLVDIGLSKQGLKQMQSQFHLLTSKDIKKIIRPRNQYDHKGKFGHALLIAGSSGKMGASVLASRAVLRSGAGLLTTLVPKSGYQIIQTAVPEAMALIDHSEDYFTHADIELNYSVVGVGPGIGQHIDTAEALRKLMERFKKPMVIDADALNIIAANTEWQSLIPEGSILTPHPKEFERLVGKWENDFDRLTKLQRFSERTKSMVVLKGAHTTIACPSGEVYFNSTGNPGMATGGSGDVLTGILTGLLAQGYSSSETARLGVFMHGLSGDLAAREKGTAGLIASDLVDFLPLAFKNLT